MSILRNSQPIYHIVTCNIAGFFACGCYVSVQYHGSKDIYIFQKTINSLQKYSNINCCKTPIWGFYFSFVVKNFCSATQARGYDVVINGVVNCSEQTRS